MNNKGLILLLAIFALLSLNVNAQQLSKENDWQNQDLKENKVMGVSANKAYAELLAGKESKTVIVAIIDSGTDIEHEDLKDNIWTNAGEIAGNGIDDDNNGYIDDIHGWSFLGNAKGEHITRETSELTRLYKKYSKKYVDVDVESLSAKEKKEFDEFENIKKDYEKQVTDNRNQLQNVMGFVEYNKVSIELLKKEFKLDTINAENIKSLKSKDEDVKGAIDFQKYVAKNKITTADIDEALEHFSKALKYGINTDFNPRDSIIGDNPEIMDGFYYGSNDVSGQGAVHGTHVGGLTGASRDNGAGMNGIAKNVKLMIVRAVPDGDERDKDVALAIRYAADNGAQIINMSFGKSYSPEKYLVDAAVKYADSLGVLMIHAAGNDNNDLDKKDNFPNPLYLDGGKAVNWLTVGASAISRDKKMAASFSNYGKKNVDIFAPGHEVYSSVLDNKYGLNSGTSMASPVAAGVAALVWSYYPNFTATQIKDILMKSVSKQEKLKVILPGSKKEKVRFGELSVSGGIINAYNALKLAEEMK